MAINRPTIRVRGKGLEEVVDLVRKLASVEVLVGFPAETTEREEDEEQSGMTNAALAYIHDTGQPEQNIPQREFMRPAMEKMQDRLESGLVSIAKMAINGNQAAVEAGYHRLGLKAQAAIRSEINQGIPPPLAEATLQARARRGRKGAKKELAHRAEGMEPSVLLAKPLVDSAQMRNAVNYAIRSKSERSK